MKTISPSRLFASLLAAILVFTVQADARGFFPFFGGGYGGFGGFFGPGDGTQNSEFISLEARAILSAPAAPTTPVTGATTSSVKKSARTTATTTTVSGSAVLNALNVGGDTSATIRVLTRGLSAGDYTVAVTKKSDSSVVTLGTFTVEAATTNGWWWRPRFEGAVFGTYWGQALPDGFDGFDVASLTVSDSTGAVVLTGDLTANSDLVKRAELTADSSVPDAFGSVSISISTRLGKATPHFVLVARGLADSASLELSINGADVQAETTSAHGRLTVRSLPTTVDVSKITSVAIDDSTGLALLSGSL